jgi:hypothetical protein
MGKRIGVAIEKGLEHNDDVTNKLGPEELNRRQQILQLVCAHAAAAHVKINVRRVIARAVDGTVKAGTVYELGGPEVKTFRELMQYVLDTTGRSRPLVICSFSAE